ncbi:calcium:proton antiporter [Francisellaceae bacterium]|nr:calcium:proton antiporter [Francisellaceae bacterium]
MKVLKNEFGILLSILLFIFLFISNSTTPNTVGFPQDLIWTCAIAFIMMLCIFNIVKHADWLAERFGEPYGTLILTLSVISIEVILIVMTMIISKDSALARDTMYAVLMITMNAFIGISLIAGGIKHRTQLYNGQGANAYLAVLVPLAVISLILPNFTQSSELGTFSSVQATVVIACCVLFYASFLVIQTVTHKKHFIPCDEVHDDKSEVTIFSKKSTIYHVTFLIIGLIVMILLSKYLAAFLDHGMTKANLPVAFGGVIIALLVLMPEGVSAVKAARENQLQRSVNLCMGSAVATICLTVPAVLIVGMVMNIPVILGLNNTNMVLLGLTLLISSITFTPTRTNSLNGMAHFIIFLIFFVLIFNS